MIAQALAERQRAIARVCFAREASDGDLEALGARDRWLLYRNMVRDRLRGMIEIGIPRSIGTMGEAAFRTLFDRWLDEAPPTTRYIREVLPAFVRFADPHVARDSHLPRWTADLARYETARWEAWYQPEWTGEVAELSFDRPALLSPSARVIRLDHPVHLARHGSEGYATEPVSLVVHRTPEGRVDVWKLNALAADLLEAWGDADRTVTETVRSVARRRGAEVGPVFIDKLSDLMAQLLERGVLLGSR